MTISNKIRGVVAVVMMLLITSLAQAQSNTVSSYSVPTAERNLGDLSNGALWDMGNTEYANGDYVSAMEAYQEILSRDKHSSSLYYNIGNVYYKQGKLGLALQMYYKSLQLAPGDADTEYNIELLSAQTVDNIVPLPQLFFVTWSNYISSRFSCMEWSVISLIMLAFTFAFLLLYLLGETMRRKRLGFGLMLISLLCFGTSTAYAISARNNLLTPHEAVVLSPSASIKSAPSDSSTEIFKLHEGTKMHIEKRYGDWREIIIDDGKRGWIESRHLGEI